MWWTLLAFLAVLATKFITSVRLKGLKAKLHSIQPHIDEVRVKLAEAEDEFEALKLRVQDKESHLSHLGDAVRNLELALKQPVDADDVAHERVQFSATVAEGEL